ncbi:thiolase domain-containing protein [Pseudomaricurvus alkylphenolicus]|uniref:acetyl-CoA acetyltransferase n=1 Tax=Pseudomaricurvus alkylphenolicus TaxID=1306991 RepID=UPI0014213EF8|nr:acetyl-CoA acetyltransferase [Pseudomaricurvus alkylphenolicus]NIB43344.1 thiolase domain-containing protein [Pseudomaricurvus alkylphenolicus]
MSNTDIFVLGGSQTDFARNWHREGKGIYDLFEESLNQALETSHIDAADIEVAHVGNFVSALFTGQAQLNGFFGHAHPALHNIPTSRHEAACASGSMALLAAMRDLEAGHYQLACVLGIELMRNVDGATGADHLAAAAWRGRETDHCQYPWPHMFANLYDIYAERYGTDIDYLRRIAQINFANAKHNPNAQTRGWQFTPESFSDDNRANPLIEGQLRKQDCGQITDGAAVVFLASETYARQYAQRHNLNLEDIPRIKGWGHRSAPLLMERKLELSEGQPLVFPHVKDTFDDALRRASLADVQELDALEVHDCFSMTEYMIIDHCGLTEPGQSWRAIDSGTIEKSGSLPINPSGGLLGLGHPVGATGVRMLLDAWKQVTGNAGGYQIEGARNVGTFNLGGSATTCATFVVGK